MWQFCWKIGGSNRGRDWLNVAKRKGGGERDREKERKKVKGMNIPSPDVGNHKLL